MDIDNIHFVGIGGIGISGLARYLQAQGVKISGSDIAISCSTKYLQSLGVPINIPHNRAAIANQSLVIHSAIIKDDNIEVAEARKQGIKVLSRSEALKLILAQKRVFSVCGAHGKSSTTAMLSAILNNYGAIIGAEAKEFGSNVRENKSESVVFEADESDGSFLNSNPYCAIVTNAEPEHMEYYHHDLDAFHGAYIAFLEKAQIRVINAEDEFLGTLDLEAERLFPSSDIGNLRFFLNNNEPMSAFSLSHNGVKIGDFEVWGFGRHNAINAALAILAALGEREVPQIARNLRNYKGIKKRFDVIYDGKCTIIDDYGHHPTEIKSTLESLREYAKLKHHSTITAIWQPHKYSRVVDNLSGFVECFRGVDKLVILPVWGASEKPISIDFANLFARYTPIFANAIRRNAVSLEALSDDRILATLDSGLIVGFGAGDITYQMRGKI